MYFVVLHCWVNSSIVMLSYVWCNDDNDTIDVCVWRGWAIFWSNYSDFTRAWVYMVKRIWKLQSLFFPMYYDTMFNTQVSLSISCLLILFWLSYLPPVCRWSKHICCGYHHGDAHKKTSSNWLWFSQHLFRYWPYTNRLMTMRICVNIYWRVNIIISICCFQDVFIWKLISFQC